MAIFTLSSFATFAGLLVAAQKLAIDSNPVDRLKAIADLATGTKTLAAVLADVGLTSLVREIEAYAREADDAFSRDPASEDARTIFWQAAPAALADPSLMTAGALDANAVTNRMVQAIYDSPHATDFAQTPMAERYFRAVAHPTVKALLARTDFIASIAPDLWRETLQRQGIQIELLTRIDEMAQKINGCVTRVEGIVLSVTQSTLEDARRAGANAERDDFLDLMIELRDQGLRARDLKDFLRYLKYQHLDLQDLRSIIRNNRS